MIEVDTNLLVYAHRRDSAWHEPASNALAELAEGRPTWAIPWPCLHEFLAIVTQPKIYSPASTTARAMAQVDLWLESPTVVVLAEGRTHWSMLRSTIEGGRVKGPQIHDARIAALCAQHGVRELWTADRDFTRFAPLRTRNPLVG
ncbi:MAG: TA system VapC family ribonuclease toxin [Planctomycetota bacterium]